MDSIGELPWSLSSFESDTFWSLSLKRSLTNAPGPDKSLEDIRSSVALPRRIEEMRFGPARHSTGLIQRFDRLKELLLLQDQFSRIEVISRVEVIPSLDGCVEWDTIRMTIEIKSASVTYSSKELHQVSRQGSFDRARITWPRPLLHEPVTPVKSTSTISSQLFHARTRLGTGTLVQTLPTSFGKWIGKFCTEYFRRSYVENEYPFCLR